MPEENKPLEQELNDTLGAIFDKATTVEEPVDAVESVEEPKEEAPVKAKRVKKEKPAEEAQEEVAAPATEITDQGENEEVVVAPVSKAPDHWSAGAKAHWDKLSPVVRAEALKQVDFVNKMQSRHAMERKKYEAIDQVLEPQRNMLRAEYGDETKGIQQLFALSDFARKDPAGFLKYFAQQRGIDLRGLVSNAPAQQQVDPTIMQLRQQIEALNQQVTGFTQQQQNTVHETVEVAYNEFASNPEYKYFEQVRPKMADLLDANLAKDLKSAYEIAVKIDPVVSELIESEKLAKVQEERQKKAIEAANKAQKAQAMNVTTRGVTSIAAGNGGKKWTDTLSEVGDKVFGA